MRRRRRAARRLIQLPTQGCRYPLLFGQRGQARLGTKFATTDGRKVLPLPSAAKSASKWRRAQEAHSLGPSSGEVGSLRDRGDANTGCSRRSWVQQALETEIKNVSGFGDLAGLDAPLSRDRVERPKSALPGRTVALDGSSR